MTENLGKLCALDGVPGWEDAVCNEIRQQALPYADEIHKDPAGNLMILRRGTTTGRPIPVSAPMDEAGFIITRILADGSLRFAVLGDIPAASLPGTRVRVGETGQSGVIGVTPIHLIQRGAEKRILAVDNLFIDIGARNEETALTMTFPGDYAAFACEPTAFGDGYMKSKAIGGRFVCALLLDLMQNRFARDVWYCFRVQTLLGADSLPVIRDLQPDTAMVLTDLAARDYPGTSADVPACKLGGGVVTPHAGHGMLYAASEIEQVTACAQAHGIACQTGYGDNQDTDAWMRSSSGLPAFALALPVRYRHTAVACCKQTDMDAMASLARLYLESKT